MVPKAHLTDRAEEIVTVGVDWTDRGSVSAAVAHDPILNLAQHALHHAVENIFDKTKGYGAAVTAADIVSSRLCIQPGIAAEFAAITAHFTPYRLFSIACSNIADYIRDIHSQVGPTPVRSRQRVLMPLIVI